MASHPGCEVSFIQSTCGSSFHRNDAVNVLCCQYPAVQMKKKLHGNESRSLVAVHKGMISGNTGCISSSKSGSIRAFSIGQQIFRSCECGLEKAAIANAHTATVFY